MASYGSQPWLSNHCYSTLNRRATSSVTKELWYLSLFSWRERYGCLNTKKRNIFACPSQAFQKEEGQVGCNCLLGIWLYCHLQYLLQKNNKKIIWKCLISVPSHWFSTESKRKLPPTYKITSTATCRSDMNQITYPDQACLICELWQDCNRRWYFCLTFQVMAFNVFMN